MVIVAAAAGSKSETGAAVAASVEDAAAVVMAVVVVDEDEVEGAVAAPAPVALSCSRRSLDSWCRHFMRRFWNQTFTCGGKKRN